MENPNKPEPKPELSRAMKLALTEVTYWSAPAKTEESKPKSSK